MDSLTLSSSCLEEENISILNDVVLALGHDLTLGLDLAFITQLLQNVEVVDDSLDESLFEITVNDTSSLWRLGAVSDGPLADLVGTAGEERAQVESLAHDSDRLWKSGLDTKGLELLSSLGIAHGGQTLLEADGDGEDWVTTTVLLEPGSNAWKMLVLLADIVSLAKVDKVDDWLGSQKEERVNELDLNNELV
jgi:hypothetical protein